MPAASGSTRRSIRASDPSVAHEARSAGVRPQPIRRASPEALRTSSFERGSMAPKVEAACAFVEAGGAFAAIGALEDAAALLRGTHGTRVTT